MCVRRHHFWASVDQLCGRHASACPVVLWLLKSYRLRGLLSGIPETDGKGSCLLARGAVTGNAISRTALLLSCQLQMTTHCHNYIFNPMSNNITSPPLASSLNYWFLWDPRSKPSVVADCHLLLGLLSANLMSFVLDLNFRQWGCNTCHWHSGYRRFGGSLPSYSWAKQTRSCYVSRKTC